MADGVTSYNKDELLSAIKALRHIQNTTMDNIQIKNAIAASTIAPYLKTLNPDDDGWQWLESHITSITSYVSSKLQDLVTQAGALADTMQASVDSLTTTESDTSQNFKTSAKNVAAATRN